ncbi:MAG: SLC13 family permease, partial [Desulfobacula sp.]|nr:SLC13 family permease [Desulfobacula sp.]
MFYRTNGFKLCMALLVGVIVFLLPRPEGTQFKVTGDAGQILVQNVKEHFVVVPDEKTGNKSYILKAKAPGSLEASVKFLNQKAIDLNLDTVQVDYVDGLSPKAKRFLAILAVLVILFVIEPIPLEITAVLLGVSLVIMQVTDVKNAWAPYMHPVVIFIMCCLIFAISLDKAGITKRLGYYIIKKAGNSVTRFTFIIAIGLGLASSFMHDAAACAIGIVTMLPLMR